MVVTALPLQIQLCTRVVRCTFRTQAPRVPFSACTERLVSDVLFALDESGTHFVSSCFWYPSVAVVTVLFLLSSTTLRYPAHPSSFFFSIVHSLASADYTCDAGFFAASLGVPIEYRYNCYCCAFPYPYGTFEAKPPLRCCAVAGGVSLSTQYQTLNPSRSA
jgi:hypothetical protein